MVASRSREMAAYFPARFWLSACCAALMPHERGASSSWHLIASPLGTIEAPTFNYTRPIGTAIPEPLNLFQTVNFDPRSLDAYAWKIDEPLTDRSPRHVDYPSVNRAHKGD